MELTFNDVQFDVIDRNNQPWVRGYQIGRALGYDRPDVSIPQIYTRHADEFNDTMTAVVTLPTEGGPQDTRIFSLRGCHLLAMFARTPVAKAFRKWVLDVLDMLAASNHSSPQPADGPLTPALRAELKAIVDAKLSTAPADVQGKARAEIWTRFNRHFKIAEYAQLPTRGSAGAAGFDLTAVSVKRAADLYIFDTGIALEIPSGYWGGIYARSSLFFTGLEKCGGVCVIDSDYRGSILVMFREVPGDQHARRLALHPLFPGKTHMMHPYKPGDRIAQLIIQPCLVPVSSTTLYTTKDDILCPVCMEQVMFVETEYLSTTARGGQGYGSTGR